MGASGRWKGYTWVHAILCSFHVIYENNYSELAIDVICADWIMAGPKKNNK
jgi:hypothetical protein